MSTVTDSITVQNKKGLTLLETHRGAFVHILTPDNLVSVLDFSETTANRKASKCMVNNVSKKHSVTVKKKKEYENKSIYPK